MKLIEFKNRDGSGSVFICPDMVCAVETNVETQVNPNLTDVRTADGHLQTVSGSAASVAALLTKDP